MPFLDRPVQAVDKNTLMQLRGSAARGFAFDRRYDQHAVSDNIYDECISTLVEKVFKAGSRPERGCMANSSYTTLSVAHACC
jgi:hypothetical protein